MVLEFIVGFVSGTVLWMTIFYYTLKHYGLLDLVLDTLNKGEPVKKGEITKTHLLFIILFNIIYQITLFNALGYFNG